MIEFDYIINHPVGLYASLAEGLVDIANHTSSHVYLIYQDKKVNMKSLIGIISLGVPCQGKVRFVIEGVQIEKTREIIESYLRDQSPFFLHN